MIDAVAALPPFALFLDELENLESDAAQRVVERLIEVLPGDSLVVIASREVPRFPLAALRVRGLLLELHLDGLRFTPAEAEAMLVRRDVGVDSATVSDVLERTEGWAAALALMAVAVANRRDPRSFVRGLTGSRRDVADFLAEEVFLRQPADVRRRARAIAVARALQLIPA